MESGTGSLGCVKEQEGICEFGSGSNLGLDRGPRGLLPEMKKSNDKASCPSRAPGTRGHLRELGGPVVCGLRI